MDRLSAVTNRILLARIECPVRAQRVWPWSPIHERHSGQGPHIPSLDGQETLLSVPEKSQNGGSAAAFAHPVSPWGSRPLGQRQLGSWSRPEALDQVPRKALLPSTIRKS